MLAALYLNQTNTPVTPPPVAPSGPASFGGPPWYYAYRREEEDECEEYECPEEIEPLIEQAVAAVKSDDPERFERIRLAVREQVRSDIGAIWRAEIDRRLQEADEFMQVLALLL